MSLHAHTHAPCGGFVSGQHAVLPFGIFFAALNASFINRRAIDLERWSSATPVGKQTRSCFIHDRLGLRRSAVFPGKAFHAGMYLREPSAFVPLRRQGKTACRGYSLTMFSEDRCLQSRQTAARGDHIGLRPLDSFLRSKPIVGVLIAKRTHRAGGLPLVQKSDSPPIAILCSRPCPSMKFLPHKVMSFADA